MRVRSGARGGPFGSRRKTAPASAATTQVPASAANAHPRPGAVGERRQRERGDEAADRHVRLADAEREAALRRGEPLHHRPAARRVDAGAERAGRHEQEHELLEVRGDPDGREGDRRGREPEREDDALADAIREQAPRQQGRRHPDPERREDDAGLAERELEVGAELRREDGDAERRCRDCGLSRRPDDEHHPAIARPRSPADAISVPVRA